MYNKHSDLFFQIKESCRSELKIKGSRFIASAKKVKTEEEVHQFIDDIIKEFHDATHHCFAWKLGHGKKLKYRYSDGGEPNHTAGLPIFKVLEARNISNIVVVVTRYFGGIKLGTGGLIRAYSRSTSNVLKECGIEKSHQTETVVFKTSFEFASLIHNIITSFKASLKDSSYGDDIVFTVEIRESRFREFITKLKDGTNGQVKFIK